MKYTHIPKLGLYASRIGFGSFRFRKGHLDVLTNAIQSGINVIDTSSHFGSGESELAIGSVLAKGKVPREVSQPNKRN
jgi:aryl-alcohol dehydrogenase-like predicted oxidoreductase